MLWQSAMLRTDDMECQFANKTEQFSTEGITVLLSMKIFHISSRGQDHRSLPFKVF